MKILLHWLILTLAVIASQYVVPGIKVDSFVTAIVVAAILAFINMIVKPIVSILTLPINILTLGLFSIADFKAALLGSLIVSVLNWIAGKVLD
jgi:putative membrane protein